MHKYPIDHPLKRIALAYFENYEDEVGVRYALDWLNVQLGQYDLEEQEFTDCLEFILNEALYNEEAMLIASTLRTLSVLVLKDDFPEAYRACTLDRLSMLEHDFQDEEPMLAPLMECLLGIQIRWVCAPKLQDQAKELLFRMRSDLSNVVRLKAFAKALGSFAFIPEVTDEQAKACLAQIKELLGEGNDWRIRVHVVQSLAAALKEGRGISGEGLEQILVLITESLGEAHPQPFFRPVAQFLSSALIAGELGEAQAEHCWNTLFALVEISKEGGTQRSVLQQLGIAMHWAAMTQAQEDRCYRVIKNVMEVADEEKTLYDLMIILAQAITGMYSWGRTDEVRRWGELFCLLVLEVEPLRAYACLSTFLRGPMAHFCFSEEHVDRLANDVLGYAEKNEKGCVLCIQILDSMVSSGFLHERYFERFWQLLSALWVDDSLAEDAAFREYLARSASGLVTDLKASKVIRLKVFDALRRLFEAEKNREGHLLLVAQAFAIFVSLHERLPEGVFEQSCDILLSLVGDSRDLVCALGLNGIESMLAIETLGAPVLDRVMKTYLDLDVSGALPDVQMAYVRVGQALLARGDIPQLSISEIKSRLEHICTHSSDWSVRRLAKSCRG